MKRAAVIAFILIIYIPITLSGIKNITGIKFDVDLLGYTDQVEKPSITMQALVEGSFQNSYTMWIEDNMPLRGVLTKTYNTIRYKAFYLGNRPIGTNDSIYEPAYLNTELAIDTYDYSIPENEQNMQNMIKHMQSVNKKLKEVGKNLYVYIAPSKADLYPEDMPKNYLALSNENAVNVVDLFKKQISETDVPYLICSDLADKLEYPAFYPTGIHWSRTYEQLVSQKVISDLAIMTDRNYRNIIMTGVETRKTAFWRDTDVYDLLNVWTYPNIDYYQYTVETTEGDNVETLDFLLVGDSFAEGLRKDIEENFQEDTIYWVNRNSYVIDPDGKGTSLGGDWENFNWQYYIDCSDIVVLEMVEPELANYSWGFLECLDLYLDNYLPNSKEFYYARELDGNNAETWNLNSSIGVLGLETGFFWLTSNCKISLCNEKISEKGLEVDFTLPRQIFENGKTDTITVSINGKTVFENTYSEMANEQVIISPDEFKIDDKNAYTVVIKSSEYFNPAARGESEDNRDLAIRLEYIGGVK